MTGTDEVHAVVLAGGGADGAYGVGVMEALFEGRWQNGRGGAVEASIFTGTSVGAYSAAIMAAQSDKGCLEVVRHLKRLWMERVAEIPGVRPNGVFRIRGDPRDYRAPDRQLATPLHALLHNLSHDAATVTRSWLRRGADLSFTDETLLRRLLRMVDMRDVISSRPLERLVAETVDVDGILHPQARRLKIATTQWNNGETVIFLNRHDPHAKDARIADYRQAKLNRNNTWLAILASAAIPALFPPIRIDHEDFVDGAVLLNAPLHPAIDAGASVLHVIHLEPDLEPLPLGRAPSVLETIERLLMTVPSDLVSWDFAYSRLINRLIGTAKSLERILPPFADQSPAASERQDYERVQAFVRDFAAKPKITVHRHYPSRSMGGALGLLDFRLERVIELIELGFYDTVRHDCEANGCTLRE